MTQHDDASKEKPSSVPRYALASSSVMIDRDGWTSDTWSRSAAPSSNHQHSWRVPPRMWHGSVSRHDHIKRERQPTGSYVPHNECPCTYHCDLHQPVTATCCRTNAWVRAMTTAAAAVASAATDTEVAGASSAGAGGSCTFPTAIHAAVAVIAAATECRAAACAAA